MHGMPRRQFLVLGAVAGSTVSLGGLSGPRGVDGLILSHGHGDHYGGLPDLQSVAASWRERGIRLYAGGEDTFCHRWSVTPAGQRTNLGQLSRAELESWGLDVVLAKEGT